LKSLPPPPVVIFLTFFTDKSAKSRYCPFLPLLLMEELKELLKNLFNQEVEI